MIHILSLIKTFSNLELHPASTRTLDEGHAETAIEEFDAALDYVDAGACDDPDDIHISVHDVHTGDSGNTVDVYTGNSDEDDIRTAR